MGLKVLSALDTAKTQYYHFKAIIVAGMGLFTDAYDLFSLPPLMKLLARIYYPDPHGHFEIPTVVVTAMVAIALLGTVFGQLLFGRLGDVVGRRRVYGLALLLMVLSSFGCGFSVCTDRTCVLFSLIFFRFLLGVGIGGDYPLSATVMSEFANKRTRGAFIAAVFSMQGFGILASSMVTMIVCAIFDRASHATQLNTPAGADLAWRVILMLGALPAALTFYWRMLMPETARYTALVENNALQAAKDMVKVLDVSISQIAEAEESGSFPLPSLPSYGLFSMRFLKRHGRALFSCAASWFLVDVVFYSSNLFQSQIYGVFIPKSVNVNAFKEAFDVAKLQAIVAICSTIPGYFATVYFIEKVGRRKIQMMGFVLVGVCMFVIGGYWSKYGKIEKGLMCLYGLSFFFSNFGPNTTTFIVPAELFPARFRSTCHGISGAAGKVGALIGSVGFLWASQKPPGHDNPRKTGMTVALVILGGLSLLGAVVTYLFTPETMGKSLEENESDDEVHAEMAGRIRLRIFHETDGQVP
ncbi:putative inorganic phosphate transporter 1-9 [Drosera capensis]